MNEARSKSVYEMLGFENHESMVIKASLAAQISSLIKRMRITQAEAAALIGISQPKLSNMLRGQFRGISEAKMMDCLVALGRDVEIVIKRAPRGRPGEVKVVTTYAKREAARKKVKAPTPKVATA